jgi:hypothetical protein
MSPTPWPAPPPRSPQRRSRPGSNRPWGRVQAYRADAAASWGAVQRCSDVADSSCSKRPVHPPPGCRARVQAAGTQPRALFPGHICGRTVGERVEVSPVREWCWRTGRSAGQGGIARPDET